MLVDRSGFGFHINFDRSSFADAISALGCKTPRNINGKKRFQELLSFLVSYEGSVFREITLLEMSRATFKTFDKNFKVCLNNFAIWRATSD